MSFSDSHQSRAIVPFALQDVVSIGYLYLLAVGMVSDSIYYGFLGITILSYSDVLDVLLSPVTYLEREPRFFLVIVLVTVGAAASIAYQRRKHARNSASVDYIEKLGGEEQVRLTTHRLRLMQVVIPAFVVASGYAGYAAGAAGPLAAQMQSSSLKPRHRIVLATGDTLRARVLGSNSNFIFYVREGDSRATISPFKEHVVALQPI